MQFYAVRTERRGPTVILRIVTATAISHSGQFTRAGEPVPKRTVSSVVNDRSLADGLFCP
jgi:hypothetical protein